MDLNLTGDTAIEGSRISGNFFGARITVSAGTVVFGDSDLSAGLGNLVTGNQYGVNTSGDILVAGNTISNNVGLGLSLGGSGAFGPGSATAFANAIFGNASGIGTGGDVLFATNVLGNAIAGQGGSRRIDDTGLRAGDIIVVHRASERGVKNQPFVGPEERIA
jgi:hypothetical protein